MKLQDLLVLSLIIYVVYIVYSTNNQEDFTLTDGKPLRHRRCSNLLLQEVEEDIIKENNFSKVSGGKDFDVYSPCDYTDAQAELKENDFFKGDSFNNKVVLTIDGIDEIAAKDRLWNLLYKFYGREKAEQLVPRSWLTYDNDQMDHFFNQYDGTGKMFIMKKNIQAQKGLEVIKSKEEAKDALQKGYVVIQEILDDPFLIDGRKTNFRIYVLITCGKDGKKCYTYSNGFMYYSKEKFGDGKASDQIITTGYIDREVYDKNPLTLSDLYVYLDKKYGVGRGKKVEKMIQDLFANVFKALQTGVCIDGNKNVLYGQLYGADVQLNSRMDVVRAIELNKGASLQKMDERDEKVKKAMIRDYYRILGLVKPGSEPNGFTRVA